MQIENLSANKGEWCKLYTFLNISAEGKIKSESNGFDIRTIKWNKIIGNKTLTPDELIIFKNKDKKTEIKMKLDDLKLLSKRLFKEILRSTGVFSIPIVQNFIQTLDISNLTEKIDNRSDISLQFMDTAGIQEKKLYFQIHSQLKSKGTFFNASKKTNIVYKIEGRTLGDKEIKSINDITKKNKPDLKGRIRKLYLNGRNIKFENFEGKEFENSLKLIDGDLPLIISTLILGYYYGRGSTLVELLEFLILEDPCKNNSTQKRQFYTIKLKKLLYEIYKGLKATSIWKSDEKIKDGLIIVDKKGNINCYHGFLKQDLEQFLLRSIKIDTPYVARHDFGKIFKKNSNLCIKLNFQLRWNF